MQSWDTFRELREQSSAPKIPEKHTRCQPESPPSFSTTPMPCTPLPPAETAPATPSAASHPGTSPAPSLLRHVHDPRGRIANPSYSDTISGRSPTPVTFSTRRLRLDHPPDYNLHYPPSRHDVRSSDASLPGGGTRSRHALASGTRVQRGGPVSVGLLPRSGAAPDAGADQRAGDAKPPLGQLRRRLPDGRTGRRVVGRQVLHPRRPGIAGSLPGHQRAPARRAEALHGRLPVPRRRHPHRHVVVSDGQDALGRGVRSQSVRGRSRRGSVGAGKACRGVAETGRSAAASRASRTAIYSTATSCSSPVRRPIPSP